MSGLDFETNPEPGEKNEELSQEQFKDLLVELTHTKYWLAIKQYNQLRDMMIIQSLRSIDPVKEAAYMARVQGMATGLFDLENAVKEEVERRRKANEEAENKKPV